MLFLFLRRNQGGFSVFVVLSKSHDYAVICPKLVTLCPNDAVYYRRDPCLVLHPIPGGRLTARIKDSQGHEVPSSQYEVSQDGEDFTFKFKKPHRSRSGKYTLVFSYDGDETEKDININFIGNFINISD